MSQNCPHEVEKEFRNLYCTQIDLVLRPPCVLDSLIYRHINALTLHICSLKSLIYPKKPYSACNIILRYIEVTSFTVVQYSCDWHPLPRNQHQSHNKYPRAYTGCHKVSPSLIEVAKTINELNVMSSLWRRWCD